MRQKVGNIGVFFVLAFGLSFLANQLPELAFGGFNRKLVLCGCGPLLAGLICYRLFRVKNETGVSLLGEQPVFSVLICAVTLVVFCLTHGGSALAALLVYLLMQFLYCLGEEFGWRHYLQNATAWMNEWLQSFAIGVIWFFWHYSFLGDPQEQLLGNAVPAWAFPPVMIVLLTLLSYLFGMMVKRTKSLLFPTVGHVLFKLDMVTMLVSGCLMAVLLIFWKRLPSSLRAD